jgi:hypothetical protein
MSAATVAQRPSPLKTISDLKSLIARQGVIVASWKTYRGRKLGPYYRLAYRANGRQRSIYLGKSPNLLPLVRRLLKNIQYTNKFRRTVLKNCKILEKEAQDHFALLRLQLRQVGLKIQGDTIRGLRHHRAASCPPAPRQGKGILRKLSVRLHPNYFFCPVTSRPPPE